MLEAAGTPDDPSRIIVVSSIAGTHVPHTGNNGTIMYSVSKAAAHHLARNLAVELGPRNITTNTVAPGFFPSKLASGLIEILGGEEQLKRANPRGRLGIPDDIAAVMLFLAGPAGNYMYVLSSIVFDTHANFIEKWCRHSSGRRKSPGTGILGKALRVCFSPVGLTSRVL